MRRPASELQPDGTGEATLDPARHAFTAPVLGDVERLLAERWNHDGALSTAAAGRRDPAEPRTCAEWTTVICGMLAAGATKADVAEYLRAQEVALLGAVRSTPRERGAIARTAWLAVRGVRDTEADDE